MYDIISVAAVASYFLPLLLVLIKKLLRDPFFALFAAYWTVGGLINLTDLIPAFPLETRRTLGVVYNTLDFPLILSIFYFTTTSILVRRFASLSIGLIIVVELLSILQKGFNEDALVYTLGVGIALVLIIVIWEIVRYMQKIEHSNRQNSKIFIYAALLFEYATFILIYIFDYFVDQSHPRDSFLIYYISSLVALFVASCGYLLFRKYENNYEQRRFETNKAGY